MEQKREDKWCRNLSGQQVGKYILADFIGAGKIGYVYRAQHQEFPESVRAVKLIFDTLKPGWETELKKVMKLELVDGVVHFHDFGAASFTHDRITRLAQYTVWDYIPPGRNLNQYLKQTKVIPTSFLLAVVERVLHVLHACDKHGIRHHGDLHSGNILIGDPSPARLDDALQPRAPIYVSDFGYGATGAVQTPKDDYEGLAHVINQMLHQIDYKTSSSTDRQILASTRGAFTKFLREPAGAERRTPFDLLQTLLGLKRSAQAGSHRSLPNDLNLDLPHQIDSPNVGYFQVTEMIGDRWEWWNRLFVPTVPARSKILALDIPTVVTGPRGCGKTMLFRRLSERLAVECGNVVNLPVAQEFVAFYVNANDFADAFANFPDQPSEGDVARLTCYGNLCILADLLAVQSAHTAKSKGCCTEMLLEQVRKWLVPDNESTPLVSGEDKLERYRTTLEQVKWRFPGRGDSELFPGFAEMAQHRWLPRFLHEARAYCPWIAGRSILLFIDDYSTPRVTQSMQRVLNRLFLQRSPYFLAKLATEASTTFVSEDSSGKNLEDGDDYQLVDMGEESLFLPEVERRGFLSDVFSRRLQLDRRVPKCDFSLLSLLGRTGHSKTEFARRLREMIPQQAAVPSGSQRRGRSRARVLYCGEEVFTNLWSGDTRTMIQLITDVVDQASEAQQRLPNTNQISLPVNPALQDRVFRNRGGLWLSSHTRNEPTSRDRVNGGLEAIRQVEPNYQLSGEYGDHLKAVVEAFVAAARKLLLGPTYRILGGKKPREVPRMAFRLEIVDEFRIDGLAREIYRDLVRYGLFIRDSRGKSVRGAFVPRLFLRRLLLPYGALALSKRDSVPLSCADFCQLLLKPDDFKANYAPRRVRSGITDTQIAMPFLDVSQEVFDPAYNDLDDVDLATLSMDGDPDEGNDSSDGELEE
jgi:hypothetical protein